MLRGNTVASLIIAGVMITAARAQEPKLIKLSDSIYMAQTTSNVYLVKTPDGNVVIDTAPKQVAADAKKALSGEVHGPVKYIILTHGHADHIGGINLWKETERRSSLNAITLSSSTMSLASKVFSSLAMLSLSINNRIQ